MTKSEFNESKRLSKSKIDWERVELLGEKELNTFGWFIAGKLTRQRIDQHVLDRYINNDQKKN